MRELILGGVKSGKSKLAEQHAADSNLDVIYIATAMKEFNGIVDQSLHDRIKQHQLQRPDHWLVIEEPLSLANVIKENAAVDKCILVDCLTLWLTNLLLSEDTSLLLKETDLLLSILTDLPGHVIFVSNETGLGIIPDSELSRQFCDEAGILHQKLATQCDRVIFTVAGLPHALKGTL
ncbi:MAG: bifunctional adenosylcobinamide kinase/adenosylcobinamide-phosphate guanylyltransferase [Gammaproteobacteria bacterium]|nr:bifunctional adenosylcobinamide kinase/adenosylcobinamide-phosphate guanylyltransferase [Gammaproteobacteria bacterium]